MRSLARDKKSFFSLGSGRNYLALVMKLEPSIPCELQSCGSFDLVDMALRFMSDPVKGVDFASDIFLLATILF